jgi:iron complex transport system ATP-binding protein
MREVIAAEGAGFAAGPKRLVDSVTLRVAAGECVALLGPNGAGKSTLLKMLCRQIPVGSGVVRFDGRPLAAWPDRELARRRAVLPQSGAVPFAFSAREIVLLGRLPHGDGRRCGELVDDAMARTDTAHLAERVVTTLSGGELQRVHLARVLVQLGGNPGPGQALYLDEPVSSLDPAHQHAALREAQALARAGVAVLVVLHDLNLAAQYADRLILLQSGTVAAEGTPAEVLQEKTIARVFGVRATIIAHPLIAGPAVFVEPVPTGNA